MEFIVANVDNMKFDIEVALEEQYGALPLPFAGMDSKYMMNVIIVRACMEDGSSVVLLMWSNIGDILCIYGKFAASDVCV
jgi:hypothetical protein